MAGRGPAPKPASARVRRNSGPELVVVPFEPVAQPALPDTIPWPDETLAWWELWKQSPLVAEFGPLEWSYLMDTALAHAQLWGNGDLTQLAELRIRVANFGITPADRARLRIQYATGEEIEDRVKNRRKQAMSSRARSKGVSAA